MMTMAPTPQQMDPKMVEAAYKLADAVAAIVANPQILAQAERARAAEHQLTDAQVRQHKEALDTIAQAGDISARAAALAIRNAADKEVNEKEAARLQQAFVVHDRNIEGLSAQQKKCGEREGKILERERAADTVQIMQDTRAREQEREAGRLRALDVSLKKREDALKAITQAAQGDTPA